MTESIHPVIIPTRNCLPLTQKAIASVKAQTIPTELLVIDNGSTDGTPQWLWGNGIQYVSLPSASVSGMWNAGVRWAFTLADYCLVINNDVELLPSTYETLIEHGGEFVTGVGVRTMSLNAEARTNIFQERPHPDFSCFLIRASAFDKVGPFPEEYEGAFYEDNAWHVRAHQKGVKCVSINLPFLHHASSTIKQMNAVERAALQKKIDKNRDRFFREFGCYPSTPEYDALFSASEEAVELQAAAVALPDSD